MRTIIKGTEPPSLAQHRNTRFSDADLENYPDMQILREYLVREQRGLCCYCMCRIEANAKSMKIEHWHCQDNFHAEVLDYGNLLGACSGHQGSLPENQHCDTYKKNKSLSRNPANTNHHVEQSIRFLSDGTIVADDPGFNVEINGKGSNKGHPTDEQKISGVLNLNVAFITNNRKAVLDGFKKFLEGRGTLTSDVVQRMRSKWNGDNDESNLNPYCQVVVYWLDKRLRRQQHPARL